MLEKIEKIFLFQPITAIQNNQVKKPLSKSDDEHLLSFKLTWITTWNLTNFSSNILYIAMSGSMMWPLKLFKAELLMIVILAYVSYYVTFPSVSGDMGVKWREIIKEDRCRSTFIFDHQILVTQQLLYKAAWALIDHYRIISRVMIDLLFVRSFWQRHTAIAN